LGISIEDSLVEGWMRAIHPEDFDRVKTTWKDSVQNQKAFTSKFRILNQLNESIIWVKGSTVAIKKPATGIVDGYIGTFTDITYLVESQKATEENKILLKTIEESSKMGFWIVDNVTGYKNYWSEGVYSIFNEDPQNEIPEFEYYSKLVHPDDLFELTSRLKELFTKGTIFKMEFRLVFEDRSIKRVLIMGNAIIGKSGRVEKVIGTLKDITELYQQKEKLTENSYLFQHVFNLAKIGTWEYEMATKTGRWSDEMKELFGLKASDEKPDYLNIIDFVVPEDREILEKFQSNLVNHGIAGSIQVNVIVNGERKTLISISNAILGDTGNVEKIIGVCMDISNQEIDKAKSKETEDLMLEIFHSSPDAIYIEDEDGYILNANLKASEVQAIPLDRLIGMNVLHLTPVEKRDEVMKNHKLLFSEKENEIESFSLSKIGKKTPVQIKSKKIDYLGKPALLLSVRELKQ
jgi:PAS domain S-box-containing protein